MIHSQSYSANILDAFGALSSFAMAGDIWNRYEEYAISKIRDTTLKLRGSLYYVKDLSPQQAKKELKFMDDLIPVFSQLRNSLESIDQKKFQVFKDTATEFFNAVDMLHDNLFDIASIYSSYQMSMPVLSRDWDSEEDAHWDKY